MHRIRFSPPAHVQLSKATNPGLQINSVDGFLQCGTKRKNDCTYEGLDTVMERWRMMVATPKYNEELVATQVLLHDCVLLRRCICAFLCDVSDISGGEMEV